jgi:transglutaminase-like putative cysteine protease
MRLRIEHETRYAYTAPARYTIQTLRLTPRDHDGQRILSWLITTDPESPLPSFTDAFGNLTQTLVIDQSHDATTIRVTGEVETTDTVGVVQGAYESIAPVAYLRETPMTRRDAALKALAESAEGDDVVARLHDLMRRISEAVVYRTGETEVTTTAAEALSRGTGVCQDHAHVFIACARHLGIPARYVSGYLWSPGADDQTHAASHAWAEARVDGLGWVGFDPANVKCPTDHYVRVAVGLDYLGTAPVRGVRRGGGEEHLDVAVRVLQSGMQAQT